MPVGRGKSCFCVTLCHSYPFYSSGCALKITPKAGLRGQDGVTQPPALLWVLQDSSAPPQQQAAPQGVTQNCY